MSEKTPKKWDYKTDQDLICKMISEIKLVAKLLNDFEHKFIFSIDIV